MNKLDLVDVIRKLIGPIDPVGETNADNERFANLQELTVVLDHLLGDVDRVAMHIDRPEASVRRAGVHASKFLTSVKET